ncbi:MAG: LicD family protein [Anaerovoracaceae bacterium]|jgi:lipopolysaccharide cholinephosphotransferase
MRMRSDKTRFRISSVVITGIIAGILAEIDDICRREDIRFFVHGTLLQHAVHYRCLLEDNGRTQYEIGFLRGDYERFLRVLPRYLEERKLLLDSHPIFDEEKKYQCRILRLGREHTIEAGDLAITDTFFVRLSPFDKVPERIDTRRGFYRVMRRACRRHARIINCRVFLEGKSGSKGRRRRTFAGFLLQNLAYRWRDSRRSYRRMQQQAMRYGGSDSRTWQRVVAARSVRVTEEQLFPLQRLPFGGITVPAPRDPSPWTKVRGREEEERLRQIQQLDLKILAEFDRVCRRIGVGYFLCGGSLLGYVRHGGFIPWDDDIDCGMLRRDYDRFLAEAPAHLDAETFFLQTRASDPTIPYLFSKIRLNNTLYLTAYNANRSFHRGLCLDLFPFDFLPEDETERRNFRDRVRRRARQHHFIANRQKGDPPPEALPTPEDRWYRFLGTAHRRLYRLFPLQVTQDRYDRLAASCNERAEELGLTTVGSFVPTYTWASLDTLLPYRTVEFAGVQAMIPNKPEVFLKMQYGDYMTPPPAYRQVGHGLIDWSADLAGEGRKRRFTAQGSAGCRVYAAGRAAECGRDAVREPADCSRDAVRETADRGRDAVRETADRGRDAGSGRRIRPLHRRQRRKP